MKLKPFGELLSESFASYRTSLAHLVAFQLIMTVMMIAAAVVGGFALALMPFVVSVPVIMVGIVGALFLSFLLAIAMLQRVIMARPSLDLIASLKAARPLFFPYIWVMTLGGLAALIGFLLLIIPGIIVSVWFAFAYFTLIVDGKRGVEALSMSKQLVSGVWWPVFWRLSGMSLIVYVGSIAFSIVTELLLGETIAGFLNFVVNLLIGPFVLVYLYQLYLNVKQVKQTPMPSPIEPVPLQA